MCSLQLREMWNSEGEVTFLSNPMLCSIKFSLFSPTHDFYGKLVRAIILLERNRSELLFCLHGGPQQQRRGTWTETLLATLSSSYGLKPGQYHHQDGGWKMKSTPYLSRVKDRESILVGSLVQNCQSDTFSFLSNSVFPKCEMMEPF